MSRWLAAAALIALGGPAAAQMLPLAGSRPLGGMQDLSRGQAAPLYDPGQLHQRAPLMPAPPPLSGGPAPQARTAGTRPGQGTPAQQRAAREPCGIPPLPQIAPLASSGTGPGDYGQYVPGYTPPQGPQHPPGRETAEPRRAPGVDRPLYGGVSRPLWGQPGDARIGPADPAATEPAPTDPLQPQAEAEATSTRCGERPRPGVGSGGTTQPRF